MVTPLKINNALPQRPNNLSFRAKPEEKIDMGLNLIPEGQSIVYFSDTHSNVSCLPKLAGFINMVQSKLKREELIKVCSGDFFFGKDSRNADIITNILNKLNLNSIIPGNHEFDIPINRLTELFKKLTMPILGANITNLLPGVQVKGHHSVKATNQNYGIAGITLEPKDREGKHVDKDMTETIKTVQKEVDALTAQGINRIILTSHLGAEKDKQIAQQTAGIDIIVSAHDHKNIDGVEEGKNVFRSKTNEPVVIFQASENCNTIGYARVAFDAKGILTKVFNKVLSASSKAIPEDKNILDLISKSLSLKPLGHLINEGSIKNINTQENALANWIADTIKKQLITPQAVIFDSRIIRSGLNAGKIREFNIDEMLPLRNDRSSECFKTIEISGKQIKALIHHLTNVSDLAAPIRLAEVSGIRYEVNISNQAENIQIEKQKGKYIPVKDDECYAVALPDFMINGKKYEKYALNRARVIAEHNQTPQEIIKEHLSSKNHLIRLQKDQRITVKTKQQKDDINMPEYIDFTKDKKN